MDVLTQVRNGHLHISVTDAMAAYHTLIKDGHIEHPMAYDPNFSRIPVGAITAQGRVFLEQGGYRDERVYLDRLLDRAKNKPVLVWAYLILSALAILATIFSVVGTFMPGR
jgi:hypothetical protein